MEETRLSGVEQFFSSKSDDWGTPEHVFEFAENQWGGHHLDVAADSVNTKCPEYLTEEDNALTKTWSQNNWCNPPFSLADEFVTEAIAQADAWDNFTTMLLKAAPEAKRFKQLRMYGVKIVFLSPRVHYIGAGKSCPFPSCLVRIERPQPSSVVHWYDLTKEEWY